MGRKHRLYGDTADQLAHVLRVESLRLQSGDRVLDAAGLRTLAVLEEVVPPPSYAVHLLRQVDRLEPHREGAHQLAREPRRPLAHVRGELGASLGIAAAPTDGGDAVTLNEFEQTLAALFTQYLAHERPERMHVIAQ